MRVCHDLSILTLAAIVTSNKYPIQLHNKTLQHREALYLPIKLSAMETEAGAKEHLRLVLLGLQGVGKSTAGNTILGSEAFQSDISSSALTLQTEYREGLVCGRRVSVVDTPGLFNSRLSDTEMKQEMDKAVTLCHPGPHAFLIIIQLGRFTEQERKVMDELVKMWGSNMNPYCMVLFTYGDKLKNKTIDQFVKEDKNLLKLIGKCSGQYHVFNNAETENKAQVSDLLKKIDNMIKRRKKQPFYVKSAKHVQYPWTTTIFCIMLPIVALLAYKMMYAKWQVPAESLSQLASVENVIPAEPLLQSLSEEKVVLKKVTESIPDQPEDISTTSAQFWQMLHGLHFNWKGLIPISIGLGTGLWILRKLCK
ncbi:GTPase IMAP family member 5-like isoform X1 [Silurus meridionalis]|uniref:GTPase IMAP family member 5-like isoform X1 n=1 Tax=Silurus meridionalis TaxID=175797 RepID=UPI001EECDD64|nr:GTPase IMAP family member 5-like isoform X1 [Silurus meridionalis]